jgi:hypothetical protein
MFSPTPTKHRQGWTAIAAGFGFIFAVGTYEGMKAEPLELAQIDGRASINVCVQQKGGSRRVNDLVAEVNKQLGGKIWIRSTNMEPCDVTIVVSRAYRFRGASGLARDGRPVIAINERTADLSTFMDELAHQIRGHLRIPHFGPITDFAMNIYLDVSNEMWWLAVEAGVIHVRCAPMV